MVMIFYDSVRTINKAVAVVLEAFIDFMGICSLHWSFGLDDLCVVGQIDPSFVVPHTTFDALVFNDTGDQGYGESSNG